MSEYAGRVALITGITGQDGSYLTEFLLAKGYTVRFDICLLSVRGYILDFPWTFLTGGCVRMRSRTVFLSSRWHSWELIDVHSLEVVT
jgi:hypothetical protein